MLFVSNYYQVLYAGHYFSQLSHFVIDLVF